VVDRNNEIIFMDKFYTIDDIKHFLLNFSSLKDAYLCVSLPKDNTMINGKWRLVSKGYQMVNFNKNIQNRENWTQRFSSRGSEFFRVLAEEKGISISRFDIYSTRGAMNLVSHLKERSPADCKFLQNILKMDYGFYNLPSNMVPMAQLEALIGAILARRIDSGLASAPFFKFQNLDVIRF